MKTTISSHSALLNRSMIDCAMLTSNNSYENRMPNNRIIDEQNMRKLYVNSSAKPQVLVNKPQTTRFGKLANKDGITSIGSKEHSCSVAFTPETYHLCFTCFTSFSSRLDQELGQ